MRNTKGITLIALVITIIVLLILAGVSLSLIAGENGILGRATKAVDKTEIEGGKEQAELLASSLGTQFYEAKYVNQEKDAGEVDDYIEKHSTSTQESTGDYNVVLKKKRVEVSKGEKVLATGILENGKIIWDAEPKEKVPEIYAKLYTDKTLILSSFDYTNSTKTVEEDYGEQANWYEYVNEMNDTLPKWISYRLVTSEMIPIAVNRAKNIIIYDEIAPNNVYGWFVGEGLESIQLKKLDTKNIKSMERMFFGNLYEGSNLKNLDLTNFDTSNVTDMREMFGWCDKLTELDLSSFDIGNVTCMDDMFSGCNDLTVWVKDEDTKIKIENANGNENATIFVKNS